jgi:glycosyltransferase involved in cell wall biosynthesis
MMRVAFVAEILIKDFDGAARTMFQLIERIPTEGFTFRFFSGMVQKDMEMLTHQVPTLRVPGNETYRFALPWGAGLRRELDRFKPDVIHIATPSLLGNYALKYAKKKGIPVISIYHTHFISYMDYYLKKLPNLVPLSKKFVASTYRKFYNSCQMIYVPSPSMVEQLIALGIDASRMKIWKRGIDLSLFSPSKRNLDYIHKTTGNSKKNILFSSRLVWEKNLHVLLNLYQQVENLPYNILVAGSGVAEEELKKRMPSAYFLGHLNHEDLSILYASADVFFFPSVTETFGNVVLEAMASGLPAVIANGGGSKDFIVEGVNGYLCPPEDTEQYLIRIKSLLEDDDLRKKMGTNAQAYSQDFDWESLAQTYFKDLKTLAL